MLRDSLIQHLGEIIQYPHTIYFQIFKSDRLSFATGWNYFFKYAIVLPHNLTAAGIVLQYWRPDLSVAIWVTVFGVCIVALNVCSSY